jgi:K+-transporting ATPase ATPase A chain
MNASGWVQLVALLVLTGISTPLLGNYMYKVYTGQKVFGDRVLAPVERGVYRVSGIDPEGEQRWTTYATSLLLFSLTGVLLLYALLRFQAHLPYNAAHQKAVSPGVSFNTAISFLTNTNWQVYSGESTMSHLSQMLGLVLQQFLSAAVGMAVVVALIRGLVRRRATTLGNFWVDTTRSVTRILLPISFVFAVVLISQGAIENFNGNKTVNTVAAQVTHGTNNSSNATLQQTIPGGPVASQTTIELLGDNGGGFFNANSGHPYESSNAITNILLMWITIMIGFALPWTFGRWVKSMGQGLVVLASMAVLFVAPAIFVYVFEAKGNPKLAVGGVSQSATSLQAGGNLEGKELRLGVGGSTLNASGVTATSAGGNGSAHESYTPLGGSTPLVNILLGEVSPGGTGSGLYGKLVLALLSVFIAGLMVGRTPEYLGKKIQGPEMKLVVLYILFVPAMILIFAGISIVFNPATNKLLSSGPHGLTELVYAYASSSNNNGSAFAGITSSTQWYETTLAICMFVGRFFLIIPVLAIGGSLARKRYVPATAGTFRTDTPIFAGLLVSVTVILVGLTYFPILALGPIVEHLAGHF